MSIFAKFYPEATPDEMARHAAIVAEYKAHHGQRPCPSGCGCTEFYDDREPDMVTGGFGVAGCNCDRCNGTPSASLSLGDTTP